MKVRRTLGAALVVALGAAPLGAQSMAAPPAARRARATPLFTRRDAIIGGAVIVGAATLMATDADRAIRTDFQQHGLQSSGALRSTATTFRLLGDPGTVILSLGTYAAGRLTGHARVAALGLHATESLLLSAAATALLKGVAGRDRPFVPSADGDEYAGFAGFTGGGRTSFPSGHTSAAFSVASVVSMDVARYWPHAAHIVTPVSYGAATLVGLSRLYNNRHWASDVLMGAAIGTYSGILVERYDAAHPDNRLARWLLPSGVEPGAHGGARIVWTVH